MMAILVASQLLAQVPQSAGISANAHIVQKSEDPSEEAYVARLSDFLLFRDRVKSLHPYLDSTHPIAIAQDDALIIFEFDSIASKYVVSKKTLNFLGSVKGLRAAFPLDSLDNRCACVVSTDALDSQEGFVTLLHEMVHCSQWATCELRLKQGLSIVRKSNLGPSWELLYPFPYRREDLRQLYMNFFASLGGSETSSVDESRKQLVKALQPGDFEYLVWEEWKEGFARYLENEARVRVGLPEHHTPIGEVLDRRSFYEVGSKFIEFLVKTDPELRTKEDLLFQKMKSDAR